MPLSPRAFAGLGAEVTIASRKQAKLNAVGARISKHMCTVVLDTTDEAAVDAFFTTAQQFDHVEKARHPLHV